MSLGDFIKWCVCKRTILTTEQIKNNLPCYLCQEEKGDKDKDQVTADDWHGVIIVEDVSAVTDLAAAQKVRDVNSVKTTLNNIIDDLVARGFLYNGTFSKENSTVAIRALSNGFDINLAVIYSGEAQVYNIQSSFDINIAAAAA